MPDVFRVELLPARHGDCIWIEYGEASAPKRILIDGGPLAAYPALAARLQEVPPGERELALLVITHVDSDHIDGVVKLLNHTELGIRYCDVWFNGWPQLSGPLRGDVPLAADNASTSRGPLQGHYLATRLAHRRQGWNNWFGGEAILVPDSGPLPTVCLDGGMRLILLSPRASQLMKMRIAWQKTLDALRLDPANAALFSNKLDNDRRYRAADASSEAPEDLAEIAALATRVDKARANGSSIAFVAEYAGKRCLFAADAHPRDIEHAARRLATAYGEARLRLDALKVPHHGSSGNVTASLLDAIDCENYLISTDGSVFGHPDDEAIARLIVAGRRRAQLLFNYRSARTERWADENLQKHEGFRASFPASGKEGIALDLLRAS